MLVPVSKKRSARIFFLLLLYRVSLKECSIGKFTWMQKQDDQKHLATWDEKGGCFEIPSDWDFELRTDGCFKLPLDGCFWRKIGG
jgi:hypothetical protein